MKEENKNLENDSINIELQDKEEKTIREEYDDILISSENIDRTRERIIRSNKKR